MDNTSGNSQMNTNNKENNKTKEIPSTSKPKQQDRLEYSIQFSHRLDHPTNCEDEGNAAGYTKGRPLLTSDQTYLKACNESKKLEDALARYTANVQVDEEQPSTSTSWDFNCSNIPKNVEEQSVEEDFPKINETYAEQGPSTSSNNASRQDSDDTFILDSTTDVNEDPSMQMPPSYSSYYTPNRSQVRISQEQLLEEINFFTNMHLAHEICVDEDFQFQPYTPDKDSAEAELIATVKKNYWKIVDESLSKHPPNFKPLLHVFIGMKKALLSLLFPHNEATRQRIKSVLDIEQMKRQMKNNAFDPEEFQRYVKFIIAEMGRLCSPARDEAVRNLSDVTECVGVLQKIMEVLDLMSLDMANFAIMEARPKITRECIVYERHRFADFLEKRYKQKRDGLRLTKLWLSKYYRPGVDARIVMSKAYADLFNMEPDFPIPETLMLDISRLYNLSFQGRRLTIIGACIYSLNSLYQVCFGAKLTDDQREKAKKHLKLVLTLEDCKEPPVKFLESMNRLAEEGCSLIEQFALESLNETVSDQEKVQIKECVAGLNTSDNKIWQVMYRRFIEYMEGVALAENTCPGVIPAGLSVISAEILVVASQFYRIVTHNRLAYGDVYNALILNNSFDPGNMSVELEMHPYLSVLLKKLRSNRLDTATHERIHRENVNRVRTAESKLPDGIM